MALGNALLLASLLVLAGGLGLQAGNRARTRPCSFYWGVLLLVLFVALPLASNLFYGPARSPYVWKMNWLTNDSLYHIYGFGTLLLSLGYLLISRPWSRASAGGWPVDTGDDEPTKTDRDLERDLVLRRLVGFLVVLGVAVFVLGTGLSVGELIRGQRFLYYERGTVVWPIILIGMYTVGLVPYFAYLDAKHGYPGKLLSTLVYGSVLLLVAASGGRKWIAYVASGLLAGSFVRQRGVTVSLRGLGVLGLAVGAIVVWQFLRYVNLLGPEVWSAITSRMSERLDVVLWEGDATYFYRASLESIRLSVEEGALSAFNVVRRLLLLPVLSEWSMGLKPEGLPLLFADAMSHFSEARRGNLPPGLFGLFVLSFGWKAGLVLAPVLSTAAVRAADWLVERGTGWLRDVVFANFIIVAVLGMRGTEGGLYLLVFNVLVVGGLTLAVSAVTTACVDRTGEASA